MQQPIWSGRRSLGSIRDIYHQLQTFFKLNLYALSLFCTTGEDWEAWVKLVLREFVVEDMSGCNGMWLLGENWAVRGFEVFGSVETREWERVRHLQYLGFLVQNILSGLCQPTFSGEGRCERGRLVSKLFVGFWSPHLRLTIVYLFVRSLCCGFLVISGHSWDSDFICRFSSSLQVEK